MKTPKLIYGDDNGFCSLWDITLEQYEEYREKLSELEYEDGKEDEYKKLEIDWRSHEIVFDDFKYENGYVPGYVGYLAEQFGLETESN